ncbi:alpha/beta hydrolase fold protein [Anaeromyxobacter dehalogenans 2CP-1]|uniref:Alpha/beta hydrolase fold protein n=2 Tax=Anaeromyxobacter dehalogenans TaxID=161493 RepID=B8J9C6_ANAD2|nr:alpha/beta hydrolase fold protein [Anaeromyxobacter dehalogenans 2CP-1]
MDAHARAARQGPAASHAGAAAAGTTHGEPMERTEPQQAIARDGTRLHWTHRGSGEPAVVLTDGIGCAGYVWRALEPALAGRHRTVHWNYRGHGRSGPPADPARVGLEDCVDDLLAVLDAAGERAAVIAGHSMGVQVALELYRRAPERVQALVLVCGAPGRPIDTFHDSPVLRLAFPFARALVERFPEAVRTGFRVLLPSELAMQYALQFEVDRTRVERADLTRYFDDLSRVEPTLFVRMLASAAEHDCLPHLHEVEVPTLVVAGERDSFTPLRLSERMHSEIPGSELLVVPGGTHVAPLEAPDLVAERVLAFLEARVAAARSRKRESPASKRSRPAATRRRRPATTRRPE